MKIKLKRLIKINPVISPSKENKLKLSFDKIRFVFKSCTNWAKQIFFWNNISPISRIDEEIREKKEISCSQIK